MKLNKTACFIIAFLAILSGVISTNQVAITKQLNDWQVLPQPVRFSELYFTDERHLPSTLKVGSMQKLAFTIHNLEHQPTNYDYKIVATSANITEYFLSKGTLTLDHDRSKTTNTEVKIPALDDRLAIKIKVTYKGITLGERQPRPQTQSIFFWAKSTGSLSVNQGESRRGA